MKKEVKTIIIILLVLIIISIVCIRDLLIKGYSSFLLTALIECIAIFIVMFAMLIDRLLSKKYRI